MRVRGALVHQSHRNGYLMQRPERRSWIVGRNDKDNVRVDEPRVARIEPSRHSRDGVNRAALEIDDQIDLCDLLNRKVRLFFG